MSRVVFLDRDGVINKERKDYVKNLDEFEIFNGVPKAIKILKEKNFLVIIITNQSGIGRGFFTEKKLEILHEKMVIDLKNIGIKISGIYF